MPHYTALAAMHRVTQTRYVSSPRLDVSDSVAHNVQAIDTSSSRQGYETRHAALRGAGRHALSDAAEVCASPPPDVSDNVAYNLQAIKLDLFSRRGYEMRHNPFGAGHHAYDDVPREKKVRRCLT